MKPLLVDTDVFSFMFKGDSRATRYAPLMLGRTLCLSFMSVAELHAWAIARRWGEKRVESLKQIIGQYVVLPYDAEMAVRWAQISEHRKRAGRPIATADCWIASTAVRHGLELLTQNGRDFTGVESLTTVTP